DQPGAGRLHQTAALPFDAAVTDRALRIVIDGQQRAHVAGPSWRHIVAKPSQLKQLQDRTKRTLDPLPWQRHTTEGTCGDLRWGDGTNVGPAPFGALTGSRRPISCR